ncbi:MAG: hypothetical protein NVS3B26_07660 [Mycobacteriales bacterium]
MNRVKWAATTAILVLVTGACASSKSGPGTAAPASNQPAATTAASAGASAGASADAGGGDLAKFQAIVDKTSAAVTWNGPTDPAKAPAGKKVGILSCTFALEGCRLPTEAVAAAAKKLGWTSKTVVANDPSQYNSGLKSLLVSKPDVVIATGINASLIGDAIKAAKAQGTLLVSLIENSKVDPTNGYDADVTPDGDAVGRALGAKMIVDAKGDLKLFDMHDGEFGFAVAVEKGVLASVSECSTCKVVKTLNFTASEIGTSVGKSVVTGIQSNPSINALFVTYDPIISVVVPALINARITGVKVYSQLGTSDALKYMREDKLLVADMATPEAWIGWAGVDAAIRLMNKQPLVSENLPIKTLQKENLPPAGQPFTGQSDGADYQAKYLALWGAGG